MTIKPPQTPSFSDKTRDEPIQEMDKILKAMQMQRNYDIEQLRPHDNPSEVSNWLSPQETSIKSPPKPSLKKNVSFEMDHPERNLEDQSDNAIFTKLKKIQTPDSVESRIGSLETQVKALHGKLDQVLSLLSRQ
jgi:hypothetical protein